MSKKGSCLLLCLLLLLLPSCHISGGDYEVSQEPSESEEPVTWNEEDEKLGFTGGNIASGGLMAGDGSGWVYYRSEQDGWKLYKARFDGSEKVLLSDDYPSEINVLDGWVYYTNYLDNFSIYRIRTDGRDRQKLVDGYCANLHVAQSGLYFDKRDEENGRHVYQGRLDGSDLEELVSDMEVAGYYAGILYCKSPARLCAYDLTTETLTDVCDQYTHNISVDETGIYYLAVDRMDFCRLDLVTAQEEVLHSGGDYYSHHDGKLYYLGYGGSENKVLCVYCLDENQETQVVLTLSDQSFDGSGRLLGLTVQQIREGTVELDEKDGTEGFTGFTEQAGYVYVIEDRVFSRGVLRNSILETDKVDCWILLDGENGIVWD